MKIIKTILVFCLYFWTMLSVSFANMEEVREEVSEVMKIYNQTHMKFMNKNWDFVSFMETDEIGFDAIKFDFYNNEKNFAIYVPAELGELLQSEEEGSIDADIVGLLNYDTVYQGKVSINKYENGFFTVDSKLTNDNTKKLEKISFKLHNELNGIGNSKFVVKEDRFILNGTLGTKTFDQISKLNKEYPHIKKIVLQNIEGSVNDDVNVYTGRLVRKFGYTTIVKKDSKIYSGGVDLFASGVNRVVYKGAEIGVHSWCCVGEKTADKLPKNHEGHQKQLSYFKEMLGKKNGPAFYFFTINAAPFDGMKNMTINEIKKYNLGTKIID